MPDAQTDPGGSSRATFFGQPLSRRTMLRGGAGILGVLALDAGALMALPGGSALAVGPSANAGSASSSGDVVIQWNNAALQAIRDVNPGPTVAARALAIMHTAMYDAWAAFDTVAVPTRPNGIPRHPGAGNGLDNKNQAVSYAAYRAMLDLFPSDAGVFQALMSSLGYNPNDTSTDTRSPTGIGNVAAQAVLSFRHNDGSNQLNGYADTSAYVPVYTPDQYTDPRH